MKRAEANQKPEFRKRLLGVVVLTLLTVAASAQFVAPTQNTPAYHKSAPGTPQPAVMHDWQLSGVYFDHDYQVAAYTMASKIASVLYQQPCYCRCDLALHHKSLRSCFEGTHGATCSTCMREAAYAYRETEAGRSPAQIRAGIERGEWNSIDLATLKP